MTQSLEDSRARERGKLEMRVGFAAAVFAVAYAFIGLLDRMGAPEGFVAALSPYFTIIALATLGALLHSMRVSHYYAAGRSVPAEYAGFALAALCAGLMLPFAPQIAARSWGLGLAGGMFAGVALAGCILGPMLRKTGAFSLSGVLAARFPSLPPRLGVIALACVSSELVALAGQQTAVDVLSGIWGGGRGFAAACVALAVIAIAAPGGLLGSIWTACAAGAVALLGFGWPALSLMLHRSSPLIGGDSAGWGEVGARLQDWGVLSPPLGAGSEFAIALAVMLGVAMLAPLLAPTIVTPRASSTRNAGVAAIAWTWVFAWLVAAVIGGASLSLARQTVGQPAERLPDAIYRASAHGLVAICGSQVSDPASARHACAEKGLPAGAPLGPADIRAREDFLVTGLPALERMGAAASGLLAAAQIALALALAAAGLQAFGTALGHEAVFRLRGGTDLTSRRLATTRLALALIATAGYLASAYNLFDARALLALALGLSAAAGAPVTALALWPRAEDRDAVVALLGGLLGMTLTVLVAGNAHFVVVAEASLVGAALGLVAGVLSARSRSEDVSALARSFVARVLHGDGDVMGPDKGA
jgi:cation/acetate symporter